MRNQKVRLTRFEMEIMERLWEHGRLPIRDIQEMYPEKDRPAYTTVQTIVYRLEAKGAVRRVKKIGNAHIFEATITAEEGRKRVVDQLLAFFGGSVRPLMAHLVHTNKVSAEDVSYLKAEVENAASRQSSRKTAPVRRRKLEK